MSLSILCRMYVSLYLDYVCGYVHRNKLKNHMNLQIIQLPVISVFIDCVVHDRYEIAYD